MSQENRCPVCGATFDDPANLLQHRRAKRHFESGSKDGTRRKVAWGAGAAVVLVVALALARGGGADDRELPTVASHWHADYEIELCGERLPPAPYTLGDVHTHGDGRIHIHPGSRSTAGEAANLAAFLRSLGGRLTDSLLHHPDRGTFRTGRERCGDTPGRVAVYVDGRLMPDPDGVVPQDGEDVRIVFEPMPAGETAEDAGG